MPTPHRRAFRHAVDLRCQIVRARDFRLVAERAVDLSTDGMLVRAEVPVLTGEPVLVSFQVPRSSRWVDADALVARVSHGRRPGEKGRQLGLVFQGLGHEDRHLLFQQLRTLPPTSRGRSAREMHPRRAG
jgi:hypothetical protein